MSKKKNKKESCGKITVEQQLAMLRAQRRLEQIASGHNAASGTGAHNVKATDIKRNRQADRKLAKRFKRGDFDDSHHPALRGIFLFLFCYCL